MSKLRIGLCPSLTADLVQKLQQSGVNSVSDFIDKEIHELGRLLEISTKDVVGIRRVLLARFSSLPVCAADLYDDLTRSMAILSTGCQHLDQLLEGGFYTSTVTEVVGELSSGKTQLCLSVVVELTTSSEHSVVWVDTCGSFDAMKLEMMLDERNLSQQAKEDVFGRIQVMNAFEAMQLHVVLGQIKQQLTSQAQAGDSGRSVKLVIIDSCTAVLSSLLSGNTPDGHSLMMQIAYGMKQIAGDFSVAVVVTNNLVGSDGSYGKKKPALGRSWASVPNVRLLLQREGAHRISPCGEGVEENSPLKRTARIIRSNQQSGRDVVQFEIGDRGLHEHSPSL